MRPEADRVGFSLPDSGGYLWAVFEIIHLWFSASSQGRPQEPARWAHLEDRFGGKQKVLNCSASTGEARCS